MTTSPWWGCLGILLTLVPTASAQQASITGDIIGKGGKPKIAVTDFRGTGKAAAFMSMFNGTLFADLQGSGYFDIVSKSLYPLTQPQRPEDFRPQSGTGLALQDWSGPPPNATHLAFGYAADQGGTFSVVGYLFDVRQQTTQGAQMALKNNRFLESMDDSGARKAAHEFSCEILKTFGSDCLVGTKIYFVSNRTGNKEIWVMDYDGQNARQLTHHRSTDVTPAISPDGSLLAYTSYRMGQPRLDILETASGKLPVFLNPTASMNCCASFTPDGKQIYFSSTINGIPQIYRTAVTGGGLTPISHSRVIETEPKVNPQNPSQLVFVSGRIGPQQIFRMNSEGSGRRTPDRGRRRSIQSVVAPRRPAHTLFLDPRFCQRRVQCFLDGRRL